MGLTASIEELEESIKRLTDIGRWITLQHINALLKNNEYKRSLDVETTSNGTKIIVFPKGGKL